MTFESVTTTKNLVLGNNFDAFFGAATIAASAPLLQSTSLTQDRQVSEITAAITPVTLSDVYNMLPMITKPSLFFVLNAQSDPQAIYVYNANGKSWVVSPTVSQVSVWQAGIVVYSKTKPTAL